MLRNSPSQSTEAMRGRGRELPMFGVLTRLGLSQRLLSATLSNVASLPPPTTWTRSSSVQAQKTANYIQLEWCIIATMPSESDL